jgi:hypothetical protein
MAHLKYSFGGFYNKILTFGALVRLLACDIVGRGVEPRQPPYI